MKNIFKTLAVILFVQLAFTGRAQDCKNPISGTTFQTWFNEVAVMPTNEAKLAKALGFLNNSCVLSTQVKAMSQLFTDDNIRYEYCKEGYQHTFDRANFFEVYDAFTKFSVALRLYDFTQNIKTPATVSPVIPKTIITNTTTPAQAEVSFPNYTYPVYQTYKGKKGCPGPVISEIVFKPIAQNVFKQPTDESKVVAIQSAAEKNCLSFSMAMKLISLVKDENQRFETMIVVFPKLYDLENYDAAKVLFPTELLKTEWSKYAKAALTPPVSACSVNDKDFTVILKDLEKQVFPDNKMSMFNTLSKDRCFSTEQVKAIAKQFNFGDKKLAVMKAAYAKCTDRANYYKLTEELTFSAEKEELQNFIKNN
jgi:hypothetical protein